MADSAIDSIVSASKSYTKTTTSVKEENSTLDKDTFLQLLVTQMRYQDPLDPGDSTEYMAQLAQFSALEATMNISDTLEKGNALNLVGEYVIMKTTDSTGNESLISGLVEYATVKNGEVLLSINDTYYSADDLDSVVDFDYYLYLQEQASALLDSTDSTEAAESTETTDAADSTDEA